MRRLVLRASIAVTVVFLAALATNRGRNLIWAVYTRIHGRHTVQDRLQQYGDTARKRLVPQFERAGTEYPPNCVGLLAIKDERRLEVYGGKDESHLKFICAYDIKGQSGELGPKLREGDRQVPEGWYDIESLNPNSRFHLALRLNYPNDFDKQMAIRDGRKRLGSHIMIHGGTASVGCLAVGNHAAEDLFVLVADVGVSRTFAVITPVDFRVGGGWTKPSNLPVWAAELYSQLRIQSRMFPAKPLQLADRRHTSNR